MHLIRGAQTDQQAVAGEDARCIRVREDFQGYSTTLGVPFTFPWKLSHRPRTAEAFLLFAGTSGPGMDGLLQRQGVDYSVDPDARTVTWLATARIALPTDSTITVVYYRPGRNVGAAPGVYLPQ